MGELAPKMHGTDFKESSHNGLILAHFPWHCFCGILPLIDKCGIITTISIICTHERSQHHIDNAFFPFHVFKMSSGYEYFIFALFKCFCFMLALKFISRDFACTQHTQLLLSPLFYPSSCFLSHPATPHLLHCMFPFFVLF